MSKKVIAGLISLCLIITSLPCSAFANSTSESLPKDKTVAKEEDTAAAVAATNASTVNEIIAQYKFRWTNGGHGYAAEQGNNLIDSIKGRNTRVVGDNNIANGPDREIIGRDGSIILIQSKYYSTAKGSIDACFDENGIFKYLDADGNVMQIEVPKDQYDAAINEMAKRIRDGKVPGVTDESQAENIVRKGGLTYAQAKNLAKAGTVESLTYDAVHGVISAGCAFGISSLLNYATCRFNGMDREKALKTSAIEGVKSGAGAFCVAVIAGQLSKTGIMDVFKPSSEALTHALGKDFSEALLKAFGQKVIATEGQSVALTATRQAAQLLRTEALIAVVTTIVFTVPDAVDLFNGRISRKQFVKNFAITAVGVVAGTVGYGVGGVLGNLVVPGVGTIPGGIVGSILLGTGGGILANRIADYITEDDADEMYEIIQNQFAQYCEDYMINEEEAKLIIDEFSDMLGEDMFKDMYQSDNREEFASSKLRPLFEKVAADRPIIEQPTEAEMRAALKDELTGVVFIH